MCWHQTLGRIYRVGYIDVFPLSIVREPATDDYKPQGTNHNSRSLSQSKMCRSRWEGTHWKEGIKASSIIHHKGWRKTKYLEEIGWRDWYSWWWDWLGKADLQGQKITPECLTQVETFPWTKAWHICDLWRMDYKLGYIFGTGGINKLSMWLEE